MPFVKPNIPGKNKDKNINSSYFVGRTEELEFFNTNIINSEHPTHNIISIFGPGGIGKSSILQKTIQLVEMNSCICRCYCSFVNESHPTPILVMSNIASQFSKNGHSFRNFEKEYKNYKDALNQFQIRFTGKENAKKIADTGKNIIEAIDMPLGKTIAKGTSVALELGINEYNIHQILKNKEKLNDPIQTLTTAFVNDLNDLVHSEKLDSNISRKRILLFFDTFEQTASDLAPWLIDHVFINEIHSDIVFIISGRDQVARSIPEDPKKWLPYVEDGTIYSIQLKKLSREEIEQYLRHKGIINTEEIENITTLSLGLPLYLGILASNPSQKIDPTRDIVDNFLRWIPKSESIKRSLALYCSLIPIPFNEDDICCFNDFRESNISELFRWLINQSFIKLSDLESGRYQYHDITKELFNRYIIQTSKKNFYSALDEIIEYYKSKIINTNFKRDVSLNFKAIAKLFFLKQDDSESIKGLIYILKLIEIGNEIDELRAYVKDFLEWHSMYITNFIAKIINKLLLYLDENDHTNTITAGKDLLIIVNDKLEKSTIVNMCIRIGCAYGNLKQYDEAIRQFSDAIEIDSNQVLALYYRGLTYENIGNDELALIDYNQAHILNPKFKKILYNIAGLLFKQKNYSKSITCVSEIIETEKNDEATLLSIRGLCYFRVKEFEKAIEDYNSAIALEPKEISYLKQLANVYFEKSDFSNTLQITDKALTIEPLNAELLLYKGLTLLNQNENKIALSYFDKAYEIDPNDVRIYALKAISYKKLKKYNLSVKFYLKSIEYLRDNASIYAELGEVYYELKKYKDAIDCFDKAIELCRDDILYVLYLKGKSCFYLQMHEKAIETFSSLIILDNSNFESFYLRGVSFYLVNEYSKAISDLSKAVEINGPDLNLLYIRGCCKNSLEKYNDAIIDFNESININPEYWEAYLNRGYAYLSLGKYAEAISDSTLLLENNPNNTYYLEMRGQAYCLNENYINATKDFYKSLLLDSNNYSVYAQLGQLNLYCGKLDKCIKYYKKSWELNKSDINIAWMAEWSQIAMIGCEKELPSRLIELIYMDNESYISNMCQGVLFLINSKFNEGLEEFKKAKEKDTEAYDPDFWIGIALLLIGEEKTIVTKFIRSALEKKLDHLTGLSMPSVLLKTIPFFLPNNSNYYTEEILPFCNNKQ